MATAIPAAGEVPRGRARYALGWGLIRPTLVQRRRAVLLLAALSLVEAVPMAVSGQLVSHAVDDGFLADDLWLGLSLLGVYGLTMMIGALGARQAMYPLAELVESLRDHIVRRVITASLNFAVHENQRQDASVITKISSQTEQVRQMYSMLMMVLRTMVFSIGGTLIGLFTLRLEFALLTIAAVAASGLLVWGLSKVLRRRFLASVIADEGLGRVAGDVLGGLRDVRACGAEDAAGARVGSAVDAHAEALRSTARAGAGRVGIIALGSRVPLIVMLIVAAPLVRGGSATPGEILGAGVYFITGLEPAVRQLVQSLSNMGLQFSVVLNRLAESCRMPEPRVRGRLRGEDFDLQLRDVTFAYGPESEPIVRELSIDLTHGCHVALVGPSGIGKSTLANLLAGMEKPQRGDAYLGGVPLHQLDPGWLHHAIALVPQEHYVFAGTLRENLCYLRRNVSDRELDDVVARFALESTLERVGGYDDDMGSISALSSGQRQLITLARIYLAGPPIVILDEATCYLDPVTEAMVESAFMAAGCTLLVIAHRISSAMRANQILVLDGTSVVLGSHEELVKSSPLYADLAGQWAAGRRSTSPEDTVVIQREQTR